MPHRSPGSPAHAPSDYLSGKPIRYYRPRGSADLRLLIDEGFQAFNAARLGRSQSDFETLESYGSYVGATLQGLEIERPTVLAKAACGDKVTVLFGQQSTM